MSTDHAVTVDQSERRAVERSFVGLVRAEEANLRRAGAGLIVSGGSVTVHQGGSGPVLANGSVSYTQGGSGPVVANGDVSFTQGGCGPAFALGNVSVQRGWVGAIASLRGATITDRSRVGIVLAPTVTVEDGGRVLATTRQALAFGATLGLALGGMAVLAVRAVLTRG